MSFFDEVPLAPPDSILGLTATFLKDPRKNKVNLGVGLYKTEDLKTPVLESVKAAEAALIDTENTKEYLPIDGDPLFLDKMGGLVFGKEKWQKEKERIASAQTVGGTCALKIGGAFLKEEAEGPIWISSPTWPNHRSIFLSCGLPVENYNYYDAKSHQVDFARMVACFEKLPENTIVLLHASCHNPTGCDLSFEEWKTLCALFKAKKLIPFFDFAYQGFGRSLEEDAEAVRYFLKNDVEMLVAVSSAKNFSLYGERAGCLFIVSESAKIAEHILSRVKQIIRTIYSNPPMHGAKIIAHILNTPSLYQIWEAELKHMRERINRMRMSLYERLKAEGKAEMFSQISRGRGMFGFTGLSKAQVEKLIAEYGIYMTGDGRINVCGLNMSNVDYVVQAIIDTIR
jgi:aspartate/tyrosine/aromatic aminotransferase